jgi:hypothetical protein
VEVKDDDATSSINQTVVITLSIFVAVVILAGLGFAYWLTHPASSTPVAEEADTPKPTEDWPDISATFTPTSLPTPRPTVTSTLTPTPTPTPTPLPPPPWGELGYLTSIEYTTQTGVEIERERSLGGIISLTKDRILLMAVAEIQAGVDLTQIKETDVQIKGTSLRLTLPRAAITSVELLPKQSQVFDSERSWIFSQYEGIEIEALDKARTRLQEEANQNKNMLGLAEKFTRLQLEQFLHQLGFEEVEITFKDKNL